MRPQPQMAAALASANSVLQAKLSLSLKWSPGLGEIARCQARRPQDPSFSLKPKRVVRAHINSTRPGWICLLLAGVWLEVVALVVALAIAVITTPAGVSSARYAGGASGRLFLQMPGSGEAQSCPCGRPQAGGVDGQLNGLACARRQVHGHCQHQVPVRFSGCGVVC